MKITGLLFACFAFACGRCSAAIPSGPPPSPLYVTNRSAAALVNALGVPTNLSGLFTTNASASALITALGVPTNGGSFVGNGALLTNISFSGATYQIPVTGWAPTNGTIEMLGNATAGQQSGYYGAGTVQFMTNQFTLTNIQIALAGNGTNVPAVIKEWMISNPTNCYFSWNSTAMATQYVTLPAHSAGSGDLMNISVPTAPQVAPGQWLLIAAAQTNMIPSSVMVHTWYQDVGNTNNPRQDWVFVNGSSIVVGGSPMWGQNCCVGYALGGYITSTYTPGSASSSTTFYSPSVSGLSLTTNCAQAAIDALAYSSATSAVPFLASNTVLVMDGDSKMSMLAPYVTAMPWWRSLAFTTNTAVGGSSLSDATNRWITNTASFSSKLMNGTNGIYMFWCMHNDGANPPSSEIGTLSNYLSRVASSNWNIVLLTIQPRSGAGTDIPCYQLFIPAVNNWIRQAAAPWRVVDVEQLMPNCYDTTMFSDSIHLTPQGFSNVAWAVNKELFAPSKTVWPERWVNSYGTNIVMTVPGSTSQPSTVAGYVNASGFWLSTNSSAWPSWALTPGGCCFVNSNGSVYLLMSPPGGTNWTATNLLGHP